MKVNQNIEVKQNNDMQNMPNPTLRNVNNVTSETKQCHWPSLYCLVKVSFVISEAQLSPFLKLCLFVKALPILSA